MKEKISGALTALAEALGMKVNVTHSDIRDALAAALHNEKPAGERPYILDVLPDCVVYEMGYPDTRRYKRAYAVDGAGIVTLAGEIVEVQRVTEYLPVGAAPAPIINTNQEAPTVDPITPPANAPEVVTPLTPPVAPPAAPSGEQPATFTVNAADKALLDQIKAERSAKKTGLVSALVANTACPFKADRLETFEVAELEALQASLAGGVRPGQANYAGAAGVVTNAADNAIPAPPACFLAPYETK